MKTFSMIAIASLATAGVALAGDPKDAKAPAAAMAMPKAPAEVAEMGKQMAGTWRCKGDGFEGETKSPITVVSKASVDLDKWWIRETFDIKGKMGMKMEFFTTFDAASKKWRRLGVDSMGGHMVGTSDGVKDGKMVWNLDGVGPMGAYMFRDHADMSDPKAGIKLWGEMSPDKGKSWMKAYEMVCKK